MNNIYITQGWQKRGGEVALRNLLLIDKSLSESTILNLGVNKYNLENICEKNINILKPFSPANFIKLFNYIFKYNKKKYTFFYVNGNIVILSIVFCMVNLFSKTKITLIIWEHCLPHKHWNVSNSFKKLTIKYFYKLLIKFSSEIIVPSIIIKKELLSADKLITIFNNPLIINTQPDYEIISKINIENINFIYVGAFSVEKDPFLFLDIVSKANKINPKVRGFLVGEGALKEELKKKIIKLNLENFVSVIDWKENIHSIINRCDAVIVTSKFETYCNVIAESLALGSIVFSSEWNGVRNIYGNDIFYLSMNLEYDVEMIFSRINNRKYCLMEKQILMVNNNS
jgi:glycosyltransferase involved in cell wall biosynthesis